MKKSTYLFLLLLAPLLYSSLVIGGFDDDGVYHDTGAVSCEPRLYNVPPFYVSDEFKQGDVIWENLRDIDNHTGKSHYIPRGTIVHTPPELSEASYAPSYKVPVEVLSVPEVGLEDELKGKPGQRLRRFRKLALTPNGLPRAEEGTTGFLHRAALIPAGQYTFFVKQDTKLEGLPDDFNLADKRMSLKMKGDMYVGEWCCLDSARDLDQEGGCFFKYTFEIQNNKGRKVAEVGVDVLACAFGEQILPVPNRKGIADGMTGVLRLMQDGHPGFDVKDGVSDGTVEFSGMRVLPEYKNNSGKTIQREYMVRMPVDHETKKGPFNSYHYNPDDYYSSDAFLQPIAMCGFMEALKKFDYKCGENPGCTVQWGNSFHKPTWKTHSTHGTGHCIDIRPMRKNDDIDKSLVYSSKNRGRYSRERTQMLVDILYEAGASYIGFQDRNIKIKATKRSRNDRMRRPDGHANHIHVCFDPKDDAHVKKVCQNGLPGSGVRRSTVLERSLKPKARPTSIRD